VKYYQQAIDKGSESAKEDKARIFNSPKIRSNDLRAKDKGFVRIKKDLFRFFEDSSTSSNSKADLISQPSTLVNGDQNPPKNSEYLK
jgi:hypothetical protein